MGESDDVLRKCPNCLAYCTAQHLTTLNGWSCIECQWIHRQGVRTPAYTARKHFEEEPAVVTSPRCGSAGTLTPRLPALRTAEASAPAEVPTTIVRPPDHQLQRGGRGWRRLQGSKQDVLRRLQESEKERQEECLLIAKWRRRQMEAASQPPFITDTESHSARPPSQPRAGAARSSHALAASRMAASISPTLCSMPSTPRGMSTISPRVSRSIGSDSEGRKYQATASKAARRKEQQLQRQV